MSSSFHAMSAEPLRGWPCVVTASRCRSFSNYGGHGSRAAVPGWNVGCAGSQRSHPAQRVEEQSARYADEEETSADCDLAYAFENYQDAMSAGGHALAAQWASARSSGSGSARDKVPKPTLKPMIQRRQGVTLSTSRYGPDAVVQRVESLAQCFEEMSVQRPAHKVTEARLAEWRKQCSDCHNRRSPRPTARPSSMQSTPGRNWHTSRKTGAWR